MSMALIAQEVGIRFGNTDAAGQRNSVAIDGIFSVGEFSRIHADVSFCYRVGIDALWDFVYNPLGEENFHWYEGVGPSVFVGNNFSLGTTGEIGLEYLFRGGPTAIGVDYRPTFR